LSFHAIAGLVALNLLLYGAGSCLLWAVRGWRSWSELCLLGGLSYMVGLAAVAIALVVELVVGVPFGLATVLLTIAAVAAAGLIGGWQAGRPAPAGHDGAVGLRPYLVTAVGAAIAIVFLEALFRAGRLAGLFEWDAMSFWVPKAKVIYFIGELDERFFTEIPGQSYSPLVPALEASAFEFMGAADVVTLHLLFWFPLLGFVAAVAGLLATRVPPLLLWPGLLLVVLTPAAVNRALAPEADLLLDYFVALAALLTALWLGERARWQLVVAAIFLAVTMSTKREGFLLAACIVAAALAVSWRERRFAWPRLGLAAAVAFATTLPWRVWFQSQGIGGEGPEAGGFGLLDNLDRAWPSFRLALTTLFDDGTWLVVMPLSIAAVVLALLAGARVLPAYTALLSGLAIAGFTWTTWAFPSIPITRDASVNPIGRLTGSLVLVFAGLLPLLLAAAWQGRDHAPAEKP
jgi:hypothetical protein